MTYPVKFRQHVLSVREKDGLTIAETAARFCVGQASVARWLQHLEPRQSGVRRQRKIDKEALARDVLENPDAYQYERASRFGVSQQAIWQALRVIGVTYKKILPPPEGGRRQTARLPKKD